MAAKEAPFSFGGAAEIDSIRRIVRRTLEQESLTNPLRLRYHDSIHDAVADLGGDIAEICDLFSGFQRYQYQGGSRLL